MIIIRLHDDERQAVIIRAKHRDIAEVEAPKEADGTKGERGN